MAYNHPKSQLKSQNKSVSGKVRSSKNSARMINFDSDDEASGSGFNTSSTVPSKTFQSPARGRSSKMTRKSPKGYVICKDPIQPAQSLIDKSNDEELALDTSGVGQKKRTSRSSSLSGSESENFFNVPNRGFRRNSSDLNRERMQKAKKNSSRRQESQSRSSRKSKVHFAKSSQKPKRFSRAPVKANREQITLVGRNAPTDPELAYLQQDLFGADRSSSKKSGRGIFSTSSKKSNNSTNVIMLSLNGKPVNRFSKKNDNEIPGRINSTNAIRLPSNSRGLQGPKIGAAYAGWHKRTSQQAEDSKARSFKNEERNSQSGSRGFSSARSASLSSKRSKSGVRKNKSRSGLKKSNLKKSRSSKSRCGEQGKNLIVVGEGEYYCAQDIQLVLKVNNKEVVADCNLITKSNTPNPDVVIENVSNNKH